jgi:hypothetical protein
MGSAKFITIEFQSTHLALKKGVLKTAPMPGAATINPGGLRKEEFGLHPRSGVGNAAGLNYPKASRHDR